MFKNVASQKIQLFAFDTTTGAAKTGDAANITAYVSKDHGAVTVLGDTSATEMDATNAKGTYVFDLTQGETNADELTFTAKSTTSNISITPRFVSTVPPNFTAASIDSSGRVDVIKIAGTTQTARDIGASVLLAAGQKVDVDTIKTNPVVNGGTVTFPTNATLASTTNITAGTIATVTTVTNQLTAAAIATGIWQDSTAGDFTTASSIGKSLYTSGVVPGGSGGILISGSNSGTTTLGALTVTGATTMTGGLTAAITGNITGNLSGSVGSLTANNDKTGYVLSATGSAALTESYAADGSAATLNQILYQIWAMLAEKAVVSTTLTANKLDGTTAAMTFTLDSSSAPTSITRAT